MTERIFLICLNITLMLIMFPSFLHDETKAFGLVVKKSIFYQCCIIKIHVMILIKIRILFRPIKNEDLIKTLILIKIIKYILIIQVCIEEKDFLQIIQILWSHYIKMMRSSLILGLYSYYSKTLWSNAHYFLLARIQP